MKKVLAIIGMSLVLMVVLISALDLLNQYNAKYSNKIFESQLQKCDIDTTLNERCSFTHMDEAYIEIDIEPGESIHVNECWSDGQVLGEYVSKTGEIFYITHSDITVQKTNSEELKQLVKSMNDNIEKLENERTVIRVVIPVVIILLFGGVVWASWKILRGHHVSK